MTETPPPPSRKRRTRKKQVEENLGRLRRYKITDLFDTFDYDFNLDAHGPTLLTGVNGTGKSTILRTIDAVSTSSWGVLGSIPFKFLELEFDTNRVINIERSPEGLQISLTDDETWSYPGDRASYELDEVRILDRELSRLRHYEDDVLSSSAGGVERDLMIRDLMERRYLLDRHRQLSRIHSVPPWAAGLSHVFPVLFITDQRLIIESPRQTSERNRSTRAAADEVARQIAHEISSAKSAYGNRSQALDHDFPQRVIGTIKNPPDMSDQELRDQLEELTRKSAALEAVGLLAKESVSEFEDLDLAQANVKPLIQTYVEDSRQKLAVLEPLRVKLQLFSEFLRQHYGHKRIILDPEQGLTIATGSRKPAPLPPGKLSSGEQQMMVLAHQILFKASTGTLVLIDEPELSLHVLWQSTFVEDLAEMGKVNDLSFLLATHSPTLIGGREDLKRSLDKLSRG